MKEQGTIINRKFYPTKFGEDPWWVLLKVKDKRKTNTITGNCKILPSEGDYIIATGEYEDGKYGRTFKAEHIQILEPQEEDFIIERLKNLGVLDEETIEKLVNEHGKKIWDLIDRQQIDLPESEELYQSFQLWKRRDEIGDAEVGIMMYFEALELPLDNKIIAKIINILGTDAERRFIEDPLSLCQLLPSDFLRKYTKKIKLSKEIRKEVLFLAEMSELMEEGKDVCLPENLYEEEEEIIDSLITKNYLHRFLDYLYIVPPWGSPNTGYYEMESSSAEVINDLLLNTEDIEHEKIDEIIKEQELSEQQAEALRMFCKNRISLIMGGPGNGKTRMISSIVALAYALGKSFNLLAPTGRATKRIRELMEENAYTIHRWLVDQKIDKGHYLIIDEASMIDTEIFYRIMKTGSFERVVFLGDTDQLPPVGSGYPFLQLKKCPAVPRTILTENFRFNKDSIGIFNALKKTLNGTGDLKNSGNGFKLINTKTAGKYLKNEAEEYDGFDIDLFRIMTPLRKVINKYTPMLREIFNEEDYDDKFAPNDWVIYRKNDSEKMIYNGDVGKIIEIKDMMVERAFKLDGKIEKQFVKETHFFIDFEGRNVEIDSGADLTLAYITTIHSSQGGESDEVIIVIETDSKINTRQLLYTAISRAKKNVILIAPNDVIQQMITRREQKRHSCLSKMIRVPMFDENENVKIKLIGN